MRDKFSGYYPLKAEERKNIFRNSETLIIFDTSALLNLYYYAPKSSRDFLQKLKKVKKRLWMPFQVGYEFHKNRLKVINDMEDSYKLMAQILEEGYNAIKGNKKLNGILNNKDIKPENYFKKIKICIDEIKEDLEKDRKNCLDYQRDFILDEITELFNGKVGENYSEDKLAKLYKIGEERYNSEIPPGYKDDTKDGVYRKYGDFIIWMQLIDQAIEVKKDIVFVTNDNKDDWWQEYHGNKIGARPELIQEFHKKTGKYILIYQTNNFWDLADDILNIKIQETTKNEIKEVLKDEKNKKDFITTNNFPLIGQSFTNPLLTQQDALNFFRQKSAYESIKTFEGFKTPNFIGLTGFANVDKEIFEKMKKETEIIRAQYEDINKEIAETVKKLRTNFKKG